MHYYGIISSFCLVLRLIYLFQGLIFILIVENIFGFLIKWLTLSFPQQKLLWKDYILTAFTPIETFGYLVGESYIDEKSLQSYNSLYSQFYFLKLIWLHFYHVFLNIKSWNLTFFWFFFQLDKEKLWSFLSSGDKNDSVAYRHKSKGGGTVFNK